MYKPQEGYTSRSIIHDDDDVYINLLCIDIESMKDFLTGKRLGPNKKGGKNMKRGVGRTSKSLSIDALG